MFHNNVTRLSDQIFGCQARQIATLSNWYVTAFTILLQVIYYIYLWKLKDFITLKIFILTQTVMKALLYQLFKPVSFFEHSSAIIINDYNYLYWAFI